MRKLILLFAAACLLTACDKDKDADIIAQYFFGDSKSNKSGNGDDLPPGVHVYSGDNTDKYRIVSVQDDGTIVVSGDTADIPKVGEIIVAGIIDQAPYGFLSKVDDIIYQGNTTILKTSNACINEVLPNNKFEVKIPADQLELDYMTDFSGNKIVPSKTRADDGVSLPITYKLYWNPVEGKIKDGWLEGWDYKVAVGLDLTGTIGADLTFYYEAEEGWLDRMGLIGDLTLKLDATAKIVGTLSYEFDEIHVGTYWLKPIVVMLGYVPVVFTPAIQLFWLNEIKGELKLSCKMFSISDRVTSYVEYNSKEDPITKEHIYFGSEEEPFELDDSYSSPSSYIKDLSPEITLSGEYKTTLRTELNVSLYGVNKWDRLGLAFDNIGTLKAEFSWSPRDEDETHNESLSLFYNLDFLPTAKVEIKNPINKKSYGAKWDDLRLHLYENELLRLMAFAPTFEDLKVYCDITQSTKKDVELNSNDEIIHIKATLIKPDFQLFADEEFGFCIGTDDQNGEIREKTWAFINLKKPYVNYLQKTELTLELPAKDFEPSTKYYVRPYVKLKNGNIIYRQRGSFTTYGFTADDGGTVDDVPGEDF